jgi:hypothetical protein
MSKLLGVEFTLGTAVAIAMYILDKSGKTSVPLNLILLVLMTVLILHPTLSIPWVWGTPILAMKVWRICLLVSIVLLSVSWFGVWTWPKSQEAAASAKPITPSTEPTTLENVDSKIKEWVTAFPDFFQGARIEEEHRSDMHFAYHLIFADGLGVAVSRNKDHWGRFITLDARVRIGGKILEAFNNLSETQKLSVIRDLGIEVSRAKIPYDKINPPEPIEVVKDIPIDNALTDVAFYDFLRDMHSWISIIAVTMDKLIAEATPPSPMPQH